ncbi:Probable N6-adenine methyltransferase [Seminavis robusta]|uniref:Probable N6-adenine methyltransferase n=1 Tax=Seminavis robusta TaxID=568900 RepID=A0A9N8EZF8_9STRA|nr:Probable N6-adenine methyltransferase [Seminavis robusta]|eukprot:Sro3112_g343960.1 Probable N6-adenine methyltransferase (268) ;mRNA; f:2815-3618
MAGTKEIHGGVTCYWKRRCLLFVLVLLLQGKVSIAFSVSSRVVTAVPSFRIATSLSGKSGTRKKKKKNTRVGKQTEPILKEVSQVSTASRRAPGTLAGLKELHEYEQFFYDKVTCRQLYQLVDRYEKPLLVCNPSLAVQAEKNNRPYMLLDRDERFSFLSGYQRFDLTAPFLVTRYDYDAVFIDPPFANVTPKQLATCLKRMAPTQSHAAVPVYIGYNAKRETELVRAFEETLPCPRLTRLWNLRYQQGVSEETQDIIWLFGPAQMK